MLHNYSCLNSFLGRRDMEKEKTDFREKEFCVWRHLGEHYYLENGKMRKGHKSIDYTLIEQNVEIAVSKDFKSIGGLAKEIVLTNLKENRENYSSIRVNNGLRQHYNGPSPKYIRGEIHHTDSISLCKRREDYYTIHESGKLTEEEMKRLKQEMVINLQKGLVISTQKIK